MVLFKIRVTLVSLSNASPSHTVGILHELAPNGDVHALQVPIVSVPFFKDSKTQVLFLLSRLMLVVPDKEKKRNDELK
jgi:hypothetical protein